MVRSLTEGIRRVKKAGSLQGLGRQAGAELCNALGFANALLSFVEDDGFVVEESDHCLGGPTVIRRRGCVAERDCIRLHDTIRTNEADVPASPGYRDLLGSEDYLVAPVIAESRVVALLHVIAAAKAALLPVTSIYWILSPLLILLQTGSSIPNGCSNSARR